MPSQGRVTAGELLVVLAYIAAVYKPLETISYTVGALQDNLVGLRMAFHILDTEPVVREAPHPVSIGRAAGAVRFEGVHFEYPGRVGTLTDISLDVQPGQVVAIVGPDRCGQDDADEPHPALLRSAARTRAARRAATCGR